ncbi:adenylate/guanylate cyclase [Nitzschia inconspicua]|uniref:Adenylate/guanylate cyclase n=1 Tax=Nitzschia inconspicua TaxID=303405 RepID=A0A9K3Q1U6_9STRA|nr:adenylate/guanylate cyclase [Nitzschia inconspicua]
MYYILFVFFMSVGLYFGSIALALVILLGLAFLFYDKGNANDTIVPSSDDDDDDDDVSHQPIQQQGRSTNLSKVDNGILNGRTSDTTRTTLPPTPPPPSARKGGSDEENNNNENENDDFEDDDGVSIVTPTITATTNHRDNTTSSTTTTAAVAEYFPSTTILFADIVGFTAWSSIRDPYQVFTLLETIYDAFDSMAEQKSVFKVETIGDCWVGATGIPQPQKDHAVIMATFSRRCLDKVLTLLGELEETLGPGTSDLGMRFGLHSGPIIGGMLRGSKCRYQLFGDTMNVASRIESTSAKNKIHLSEQTADLLMSAGKGDWIERRNRKIVAKGKGELQTFWLTTDGPKHLSPQVKMALPAISKFLQKAKIEPAFCEKKIVGDVKGRVERLVDYNVKVMERLLKRVTASRRHSHGEALFFVEQVVASYSPETILKEAQEGVAFMPGWKRDNDPTDDVDLEQVVTRQLHLLVSKIAESYRDLPFHCFEHASHTTLSVTKLLASLEATLAAFGSQDTENWENRVNKRVCEMLTHPMSQFTLFFASMIHDAEYEVPNFQLVKEGSDIAKTYKNKSCAEQNSIHSAWKLLMQPCFRELRACLFQSREELQLFRSLLVKSVMATDIWDMEHVSARECRWEQVLDALQQGPEADEKGMDELAARKAALVAEYLIQISDVSHTTQHSKVYEKWNKLLFKEMFLGYKTGRGSSNPTDNWYNGELKFFDGHVIPLAKRLCECHVFRASAEICLTNAINNRRRWEEKGNSTVQEYLTLYDTKSAIATSISDQVRRVPSICSHVKQGEEEN